MLEKRSKEINRKETSWLWCVKMARDYVLDLSLRAGTMWSVLDRYGGTGGERGGGGSGGGRKRSTIPRTPIRKIILWYFWSESEGERDIEL